MCICCLYRQVEEIKEYGKDEAVFLENGFISSSKETDDVKSTDDTTDLDDELNIFKGNYTQNYCSRYVIFFFVKLGSYSEREKEKWKHPSVDIPDNPYSPENLERRLSSRSSNESGSSM